jgi:hypothetical protein
LEFAQFSQRPDGKIRVIGMMLRSGGNAFWGAVLRAPLYWVLLVFCANTTPARADYGDPQPPDSCEYRNVLVEIDPFRVNDVRVEPLRQTILSRAVEVFPELGLKAVTDPSAAYWRLFANAWMDRQGNPLVHLGMRGELKLGRHLFVVAMADESFPSRGVAGGGYNFVNAPLADTELLDSQVETGMRWIWGLDSEQIAALCAIRSELIDEGWATIEELRNELIEEMDQVRRARARASQQKKLELEVERTGQSERAE